MQQKWDWQGARHEFETSLEINPKDHRSHFNLGLLLAKQGQIGRVVEELQTAVSLKPDDETAGYALRLALKIQRDLQSAQKAH